MFRKQPARQKRKAKKQTRRVHGEKESSTPLLRHVLLSVCVSLCTALLSLLAFSVIAALTADPAALLSSLGLVAAALVALVGGFTAVRLHKKSALVCGLANGCAMLALFLLASLFFKSAASAYSPLVSCLLHVGYLALSVLGAFAALPHGTTRRNGSRARRHRS